MKLLYRSIVATLSLCIVVVTSDASAESLAMTAGSAAALRPAPVPPESLDKLLGPIALYPDALVLQILECSAKPEQVKKLSDWLQKNPNLKGTAAQDAALAEGFEPSFVAIVMFPQVVKMMADQPNWTKDVGMAFTGDRSGTFASLQRLRTQAQSMGNLATNEQQKVETVNTESGQQVIVIQPANPEIVYVPQYSPTVVYTQPPPPPGQTAAAGLIGFTTGVIIGAAIADNNNDCWAYHGGMSNENYEDYAQHRENMASQRGENQGNRQSSRTENQSNRQSSSSANQAQRQESRGTGQSASSQSAGGKQAGVGTPTAAARGSAGASATPSQRAGTSSSAMSGYQSGSKEREASARGRSSTSTKSSGGSRGGGGRGR